jgi:predicted nucleic acid-binding protein
MAYAAVLDADVLHPYNAADLLLRLAEHGLFRPIWSRRILSELGQSLLDRSLSTEQVEHRLETMAGAFEEAMVADEERFVRAVPLEVHEDDRHVVATAMAGKADGIVTNNLRHFPPAALARIGLEGQSLDDFLTNQLTLDTDTVLLVLQEIEADRTRPPRTPAELLDALEPSAPGFARLARSQLR